MPDFSSLFISIRHCYLFSATIIGFARVVIDNEILLKEIPIFRSDHDVMVQVSIQQVAACPMDMDLGILNRMIWSFRESIEMTIVEEWKKQRNGYID